MAAYMHTTTGEQARRQADRKREANGLGALGEEMAARYLVDKGYAIVEKNYRRGRHEIDLIAYKDGVLAVVEVKTRSDDAVALPEAAVDRRKRKALVEVANEYVQSHRRDEPVRFDIISIVKNGQGTDIRHIEDAFNVFSL